MPPRLHIAKGDSTESLSQKNVTTFAPSFLKTTPTKSVLANIFINGTGEERWEYSVKLGERLITKTTYKIHEVNESLTSSSEYI